jgi:hypothetical protein
MKNALRVFIALWYLLGWLAHVYLAITAPTTYAVFGQTALLPLLRNLWQSFIMPNIRFFALLLAAFEIVVGCLLVSKGRWVKIGLVFSLLFNLFLIVLGLGTLTADPVQDFVANRMPNLLFIALQIPLFFWTFDHSIPEVIRSKFSHSRSSD